MSSNSNNNYRGRSPYRGRGNYKGGNYRSKSRGSGNGKGNKSYGNKSNSKSTTTKEYKFAPQTQGKVNYATYAATKDVVLNYIQKNYKGGLDVVECLRQGKARQGN